MLKIHRRIKQGIVWKRVCNTISFTYLTILTYGTHLSTSLESNLIIVFLSYNINLKRHLTEGLDIFIIKNMCNGVSVQIIYMTIIDQYYSTITQFLLFVRLIKLASFSDVQVTKRKHQLPEFPKIHPFEHVNNLHMLSERIGSFRQNLKKQLNISAG